MRGVRTDAWSRPACSLVALLLAGVVSFYASSSPDGLTKVAEDKGFADTEKDARSRGRPARRLRRQRLDDDRLSGGLAGVVGVLVVLVLAGGLDLRRTPPRAGRRPSLSGLTHGRRARPQAALPRALAGPPGARRT